MWCRVQYTVFIMYLIVWYGGGVVMTCGMVLWCGVILAMVMVMVLSDENVMVEW